MEKMIHNIIKTITKCSDEVLIDSLDVEGFWDSFAFVEIVIELEEEFDISITKAELENICTINELVALVTSKSA